MQDARFDDLESVDGWMDSFPMTLPTWESCLRTKWAYIIVFFAAFIGRLHMSCQAASNNFSDPASTPCVKTYELGHKAKRLYCVISRHFKALQWALHQEV